MQIDIGNTKLFFEVYGSKLVPAGADTKVKPTMIFLHGGVGFFDHTVYIDFWSQFSDVAEVIFVDLNGGGRSPCDDQSTWNLKQWGEDIYQFCQKLHIEKPILAGMSVGGRIALSCAIQHPDLPSALVLTDTEAKLSLDDILDSVKDKAAELGVPADRLLDITRKMFTDPMEDVSEAFFSDVYNLFGEPEKVFDKFVNTDPKLVNAKLGKYYLHGEFLTCDLRQELQKITMPTLFLNGDQGPLHSLKPALELIELFSKDKLQYKILKNAKAACYEFYPEEAAKLIRDFIQ